MDDELIITNNIASALESEIEFKSPSKKPRTTKKKATILRLEVKPNSIKSFKISDNSSNSVFEPIFDETFLDPMATDETLLMEPDAPEAPILKNPSNFCGSQSPQDVFDIQLTQIMKLTEQNVEQRQTIEVFRQGTYLNYIKLSVRAIRNSNKRSSYIPIHQRQLYLPRINGSFLSNYNGGSLRRFQTPSRHQILKLIRSPP